MNQYNAQDANQRDGVSASMFVSAVPVIAVDGPSGSGKGTVCLAIAKRLGFHLLDSGAIYRALACWSLSARLTVAQMIELLHSQQDTVEIQMTYNTTSDQLQILVNELDVSQQLRSERCANVASQLAKHREIRDKALQLQRACARPPGLVADGRDMGSTVFPQAKLKIFLTAELETRAQRRFLQLQQHGLAVNLRDIYNDMRMRDDDDRHRALAPLVPDPAAVIIDNTKLTIDETVQRVLKLAQQAGIQ